MSKHYTLNISAVLKESVSPKEREALEFLINGAGEIHSDGLPDHPYFALSRPFAPLSSGYEGFAPGEYLSVYWKGRVQGNSGVSLRLPGIKDAQGWHDALKFVAWLCSLTESQRLIGYISDDDEPTSFSLLYSFDGNLYFHDDIEAGSAISFTTGRPRPEQHRK